MMCFPGLAAQAGPPPVQQGQGIGGYNPQQVGLLGGPQAFGMVNVPGVGYVSQTQAKILSQPKTGVASIPFQNPLVQGLQAAQVKADVPKLPQFGAQGPADTAKALRRPKGQEARQRLSSLLGTAQLSIPRRG